ncbi:hypothetical protein LUW76_45960 [Actinomadura madurae]|nr:hypothetical protein [Actinomadura madurae]URN01072.1 hypothetical protein LUW76_45960 [Actinomadura madurae]URN03212.1 hypothetical protein LUW74_07530 [Actinomadura madurae]
MAVTMAGALTAGPVDIAAAAAPLAGPAGAPGVPDDSFFTYSRPARFGATRTDVRVPVRDGGFIH